MDRTIVKAIKVKVVTTRKICAKACRISPFISSVDHEQQASMSDPAKAVRQIEMSVCRIAAMAVARMDVTHPTDATTNARCLMDSSIGSGLNT